MCTRRSPQQHLKYKYARGLHHSSICECNVHGAYATATCEKLMRTRRTLQHHSKGGCARNQCHGYAFMCFHIICVCFCIISITWEPLRDVPENHPCSREEKSAKVMKGHNTKLNGFDKPSKLRFGGPSARSCHPLPRQSQKEYV